jgi:hypothetical protein
MNTKFLFGSQHGRSLGKSRIILTLMRRKWVAANNLSQVRGGLINISQFASSFGGEGADELLVSRPSARLDGHSSSAVRNCLFSGLSQ